jgi:hypothetical protein
LKDLKKIYHNGPSNQFLKRYFERNIVATPFNPFRVNDPTTGYETEYKIDANGKVEDIFVLESFNDEAESSFASIVCPSGLQQCKNGQADRTRSTVYREFRSYLDESALVGIHREKFLPHATLVTFAVSLYTLPVYREHFFKISVVHPMVKIHFFSTSRRSSKFRKFPFTVAFFRASTAKLQNRFAFFLYCGVSKEAAMGNIKSHSITSYTFFDLSLCNRSEY